MAPCMKSGVRFVVQCSVEGIATGRLYQNIRAFCSLLCGSYLRGKSNFILFMNGRCSKVHGKVKF